MSDRLPFTDERLEEIIKERTPPGIEAFFHTSGDLAYCLALDLRNCRTERDRLRECLEETLRPSDMRVCAQRARGLLRNMATDLRPKEETR